MVKRIPCRVIRTVSLSKSSDLLRHAGRSDNKGPKARDIIAVDVRVRHGRSSVIYTRCLGTLNEAFDDGPIGQILDFYV